MSTYSIYCQHTTYSLKFIISRAKVSSEAFFCHMFHVENQIRETILVVKLDRRFRNSSPEVFLQKDVLKYAAKLYQNTQSNVIEFTFWHECSLVNNL